MSETAAHHELLASDAHWADAIGVNRGGIVDRIRYKRHGVEAPYGSRVVRESYNLLGDPSDIRTFPLDPGDILPVLDPKGGDELLQLILHTRRVYDNPRGRLARRALEGAMKPDEFDRRLQDIQAPGVLLSGGDTEVAPGVIVGCGLLYARASGSETLPHVALPSWMLRTGVNPERQGHTVMNPIYLGPEVVGRAHRVRISGGTLYRRLAKAYQLQPGIRQSGVRVWWTYDALGPLAHVDVNP